jgi:hypothetical protein
MSDCDCSLSSTSSHQLHHKQGLGTAPLGKERKGKKRATYTTTTEIAAMGVEQDEIVNSFLVVTGASDAQARFFLESTNWELEAALISFFEAADEEGTGGTLAQAGVEDNEEEEMRVPESVGGARQQERRDRQGAGAWRGRSTGSTQTRFPSSTSFKGKEQGSGKKGSPSRGGITTLSDLSRQPDSDGDSDEGPQEYYTGGEKRLAHIHKEWDLMYIGLQVVSVAVVVDNIFGAILSYHLKSCSFGFLNRVSV